MFPTFDLLQLVLQVFEVGALVGEDALDLAAFVPRLVGNRASIIVTA